MHLAKSNQESLDILDQFIANNIHYYSSKRNFDFGPENRSNVSLMSPYISHRILTEYNVIKRVLRKKSYQSVEKFIQEVFWRLYWRGWLESRPKVWDDFISDLKSIEKNKKSFITIYLNSVHVTDIFKKYAGPCKSFYDGKIYLKYILREQEYNDDAELKIIDNTGKFHVIYLQKYGPSEYYEFI